MRPPAPTVLVAGDWHLSPVSPPLHATLACAFLRRARAGGATVVLNGDVFDELFFGPRAAAAHPAVLGAVERLRAEGRLLRLGGNHDPSAGEDQAVLEVAGLGRVLVAHGHRADPLHRSPLGRLGDAISRHLGALPPTRAAARLAERLARALAGDRMVAVFRRRCLALVDAERCHLGVFGHVHVPHLAPGDRYANAGALVGATLTYVALGPAGADLLRLGEPDLPGRDGSGTEMG
jgi:UDP-2,3-diacylglucosamine pyrophosphatase LpxH